MAIFSLDSLSSKSFSFPCRSWNRKTMKLSHISHVETLRTNKQGMQWMLGFSTKTSVYIPQWLCPRAFQSLQSAPVPELSWLTENAPWTSGRRDPSTESLHSHSSAKRRNNMIKVNSQNINKNSKYLSSSRFNFLILSINDVLHKLDVICPHSHLGFFYVWCVWKSKISNIHEWIHAFVDCFLH